MTIPDLWSGQFVLRTSQRDLNRGSLALVDIEPRLRQRTVSDFAAYAMRRSVSRT